MLLIQNLHFITSNIQECAFSPQMTKYKYAKHFHLKLFSSKHLCKLSSISIVFTNFHFRQCQKTYTGGEIFSTCFWNSEEGTRCICTKQLCNNQWSLRTETLLAVWMIVIFFTWIVKYLWNFFDTLEECHTFHLDCGIFVTLCFQADCLQYPPPRITDFCGALQTVWMIVISLWRRKI